MSAVMAVRGELRAPALAPCVAAQLAGAVLGAGLAHAMFGLAILQWSAKVRSGSGQWLAEAVATAGLLLTILRASRAPATVAACIAAAYGVTASTSFASPAAAFGRMFSDSFAGIAPRSVPGFVAAQLAGAFAGLGIDRLLGPPHAVAPSNVVEASAAGSPDTGV